jgi:hypothetical protein
MKAQLGGAWSYTTHPLDTPDISTPTSAICPASVVIVIPATTTRENIFRTEVRTGRVRTAQLMKLVGLVREYGIEHEDAGHHGQRSHVDICRPGQGGPRKKQKIRDV